MYCAKCGMIIHPEEEVNYKMCEECYDKYLEMAVNEYKNNGLLGLKMFAEVSKFLH